MVVAEQSKSTSEVATLYTATNPVEKLCAVDDPVIIEWKGKRYATLMRGVKVEVIATNSAGGKGRVSILPEMSCFITDMPKGHAAAGFVNSAPLTMRFLSGGAVYAFKTALVRVHNQPPVFVMEYPDKLQRYNLRGSERISIVSRARISLDFSSDHRTGAVLDISVSGARIGLGSLNGLSLGSKLHLSFTLPNGMAVSQLTAVVRNISEENEKYLLGVGFLGHDPAVSGFCRNCLDCLE